MVDDRLAEDAVEVVAERMADAILYLSDVAIGSGLEAISDDLMSIRRKLNDRLYLRSPQPACSSVTEVKKASGVPK